MGAENAEIRRLGEKYTTGLEGSHYDKILPFLSLYWFTDCYGSSIWFYKTVRGDFRAPFCLLASR